MTFRDNPSFDGHFDPIKYEPVLVERLNRPIRTGELFFDFLLSSNFATGVSGFRIQHDGTAEFASGITLGPGAVTIAADLKSSDWDGASDDLSSGPVVATEGYLLDYSSGAAQFQDIYAEGGVLGTLTVSGTLQLDGTGELKTAADGADRLEIVQANNGEINWYDDANQQQARIGLYAAGATSSGLLIRGYSTAVGQTGMMDLIRYTGGAQIEFMTPTTAAGSGEFQFGTVAANGVTKTTLFYIRNSQIDSIIPYYFSIPGSESAPNIGMDGSGDDTGLWFDEDVVAVTTQGTERLHFNTTRADFSVPVKLDAGAEGTPSLYFVSVDDGFWQSAADKLNVSIAGSEVWEWGAATHISTEPLWLPAGAVSAASVQLNDADTGLYSTGTGVADMAAAGARVQAWNADGPMVENAITKFPSQVSATPAQITTFANTNWIAGTAYTLWTHSGTNRDVWVQAIARFEWGETAAVAYTGECRLGVSFDGGSTWTYGATSIHFMGTGTGGCGYRGSGTVIFEGQGAAAAVTGDIQMRLEHKVSNTSMDRLVNQHIMGRVEQIF